MTLTRYDAVFDEELEPGRQGDLSLFDVLDALHQVLEWVIEGVDVTPDSRRISPDCWQFHGWTFQIVKGVRNTATSSGEAKT
jgi:hypothetical protein